MANLANPTKLDYLSIAAHPDDSEITCGGLLIKMAKSGLTTGALDLTTGEMGTQGDPKLRKQEADEASKRMKLSFRRQLDLPDSAVQNDQPSRLKIAQVIRDTQPETVILPHWEQRHPDHRVCSQLGFDACFLAGLKKAPLAGEPFRPTKILYVTYFRNQDISFLIDISEQLTAKLSAVAAYKSQFGDSVESDLAEIVTRIEGGQRPAVDSVELDRHSVFQPGTNIFEYLQVRARALGLRGGVEYAEAFTVKELVALDSPDLLLNHSI